MKKNTARRLAFVALLLPVACHDPIPPVACGAGESLLTVPDHTVQATACFTDANQGDLLTYTVQSSSPNVATASISGTHLSVTGQDAGSATVTVTATDSDMLTATQIFPVSVVYGVDLGVTGCNGEPAGGFVRVTVEGWVEANIALRGVEVEARVGGRLVGRVSVGSMARGQRATVRVTGLVSNVSQGDSCTLEVFGNVAGDREMAATAADNVSGFPLTIKD